MTDLSKNLPKAFAHRGLHDGKLPENSLAAFEAAASAGYGIELDVVLSADGVPVIFHDATLKRLTELEGSPAQFAAVELARAKLAGSAETIPSLGQVLKLVAGRVSLLVEIKTRGLSVAKLCQAVDRQLTGYDGAVIIVSSNPLVLRWFQMKAPKIPRALSISNFNHTDAKAPTGLRSILSHLWLAPLAKPQILSCDIRDLPNRRWSRYAARHSCQLLAWTCNTSELQNRARKFAAVPIFEEVNPT